jgi:hypothetical protein
MERRTETRVRRGLEHRVGASKPVDIAAADARDDGAEALEEPEVTDPLTDRLRCRHEHSSHVELGSVERQVLRRPLPSARTTPSASPTRPTTTSRSPDR